ncbi:ArnT family glycosyltransferase [Hymenobacter psychrotolerans]|uniref:Dolichyl-phosphate-mannose-protein mannosyltransferase n=1 Tax=Hymenobacter psychrotolerans DSM 18569 TaxID=1121959 RepID=A0A1M7AHC9_9BACT|nr:glycosyltransferase family 39 protein [Hymenobacter psychrotolerans]SHL41899.1 Dolichyl-phosphate-mannose-protein mannosyltransferase [Hymenobacter psychrotolerans DSM 18569]
MPTPARPLSSRIRWSRLGPLLLLLLLAFLPLFWLLDSHPVQQYDEARTGLNGLNIVRHNEWLVLRDGELKPDLWNCKPPLWPWLLSLSFRVVGLSELGLRLPAALAALATTLVVYAAGRRWLGSWEGGLLAALILLTSGGYIGLHTTRTGDFDALLTLWTTLGALSWLSYLQRGQARAAALTGLFFFLAAFTKGVAGLLFGPGLVLATLVLGQTQRLRRPAPWLALAGLAAGMATWYLVREQAAPGYLAAVWQYELGGPAGSELEGHHHEAYWYLTNLMESGFIYWLVPALLGGLLGWRLPKGSQGWWLVRFVLCVVGMFMLVLALTQTKLHWYSAPMFPLLALLAASGLLQMGRAVAAQQQWHLSPLARLGGLLVLVCLPYWAQCRAIARIYDDRYRVPSLRLGAHLRHQLELEPGIREYYHGDDGQFNDSPIFYRTIMEMQHGHRIERVPPWKVNETSAGRLVVICGAKPRREWERWYRTTLILQTDSCVTLRLETRR